MATDLGLLSQTQHQNQNQSKPNSSFTVGSWMWNPRQQQSAQAQATDVDEDDSWEVRAFEEDTNQAMGTTWPPRSYTCTFCMREFKSAQALGGHMNVHRRDRARLHQPVLSGSNTLHFHGRVNTPAVIFPNEDFMANGSVCLMYTLPNPNTVSTNGGTDPPSSRPAMSHFQGNNMVPHFPTSIDFSLISRSSINSSQSHSSNTEPSASTDYSNYQVYNGSPIEELDLELRLGRHSSWS